ncbi:hypothetical protein D3C71_1904870 [compost metagenome]
MLFAADNGHFTAISQWFALGVDQFDVGGGNVLDGKIDQKTAVIADCHGFLYGGNRHVCRQVERIDLEFGVVVGSDGWHQQIAFGVGHPD